MIAPHAQSCIGLSRCRRTRDDLSVVVVVVVPARSLVHCLAVSRVRPCFPSYVPCFLCLLCHCAFLTAKNAVTEAATCSAGRSNEHGWTETAAADPCEGGGQWAGGGGGTRARPCN
jgi:hypothetical protein